MTKESDSSKKKSSPRQEEDIESENAAGDIYNLPGDYRGANIYIKSTIVSTKNNVRLQNLRDFTVQIRNANDQIVGTGIAVSTDGKIVTCAHVVRAAGIYPQDSNSSEVGVYFPQARGGEEKNRRATIAKYFMDFDDDIVLLQLTGGVSPLAPEQIPVLGTASSSDEHPFRSYGYRRLHQYVAGWAHGKIQGAVEAPQDFNVQCEPVQLESSQINSGMSGAAVLDMARNLVVGIVSETWFPDLSTKDRDTAWAVDGRVLSLEPLGLPLQDISLPLKAAPEPKTDEQTKQQVVEVAQVTVEQRTTEEKYSWNNAPPVLTEWTGRNHLLAQITEDWKDNMKHVVGLIGFGGEGKSSLARKWVDNVLNDSSLPQPDGVFWWGFYENRSIDEFFESALKYFGVDSRRYQSSSQRAQIVGVLLNTGRYLFVLDGLEVLQHQDGDQYGLLQSNDLRDLLTFFARPDNQSFCLITSRAPLLDLMEYTTYTHRDVDRLSDKDGYDLLVKLGVKGTKLQLDKIVSDWNGHALTLSLIGSYLVKVHNGDASHVTDFNIEEDEEVESSAPDQYKHVGRILRRYDEHLNKEEKAFLILFSAFRTPVHISAFEKVFRTRTDATALNASLTNLSDKDFSSLVDRLVKYRILRFDAQSQTYTTHPLIRNHYFALLTRGSLTSNTVKAAHEQIKDYYLSIAGDTPEYPTLDDLKPLIEVVHHACQAGMYDDAIDIFEARIYGAQKIIYHILGAYETALNIFYEFFSGDLEQSPLVSKPDAQHFILANIGFCLMGLGRLYEAIPFYERAALGYLKIENWSYASIQYRNLAGLYVSLGAILQSHESSVQALDLARQAENKRDELFSLVREAHAVYLQGDLEQTGSLFDKAEILQRETESAQKYLYEGNDILHIDYLRRVPKVSYARKVIDASMEIASRMHVAFHLSQCYRVLGDLDSDTGHHISARSHYDSALRIARGIRVRDVLIETLLARGRQQAKQMKDSSAAFNDLNEALGYCVDSGYRIYEADVRIALAWAYLANGEKEKAKGSAERALQMSNEMSYYWGKVDAEEVLSVIARSGEESKPSRRATPSKTKKSQKSKSKRRSNLK